MSTRNLLPAPEVIDAHPVDADDVRERLDALEKEISSLRSEMKQNLQQLSALLRSARVTFGDASSPAPSTTEGPLQPPDEAAYRMWKERLPKGCGQIIDALLIQPLTQFQMRAACKMGQSSVSTALKILRTNKIVEMDGNLFRLRRL